MLLRISPRRVRSSAVFKTSGWLQCPPTSTAPRMLTSSRLLVSSSSAECATTTRTPWFTWSLPMRPCTRAPLVSSTTPWSVITSRTMPIRPARICSGLLSVSIKTRPAEMVTMTPVAGECTAWANMPPVWARISSLLDAVAGDAADQFFGLVGARQAQDAAHVHQEVLAGLAGIGDDIRGVDLLAFVNQDAAWNWKHALAADQGKRQNMSDGRLHRVSSQSTSVNSGTGKTNRPGPWPISSTGRAGERHPAAGPAAGRGHR